MASQRGEWEGRMSINMNPLWREAGEDLSLAASLLLRLDSAMSFLGKALGLVWSSSEKNLCDQIEVLIKMMDLQIMNNFSLYSC